MHVKSAELDILITSNVNVVIGNYSSCSYFSFDPIKILTKFKKTKYILLIF